MNIQSFIEAHQLVLALVAAIIYVVYMAYGVKPGQYADDTPTSNGDVGMACVTAHDVYMEGVFGVDDGRDRCESDYEDMDYSSGPHDRHVIEMWNYVRGLPIALGELAVKVDDAGWSKDAECLMTTSEAYGAVRPEVWHREVLESNIAKASALLDPEQWRSYWVAGDITPEFFEQERMIVLRDELFGYGSCIEGCWLMSVRPDLVWLAEMYVEEGILEEAVVEVEYLSDENHYEPTGSFTRAPAWEPKDSDIPF